VTQSAGPSVDAMQVIRVLTEQVADLSQRLAFMQVRAEAAERRVALGTNVQTLPQMPDGARSASSA
jgi:hypothetical protein